ncbi:hypothetical protein OHA72_16130 [Dactylosporangium sp. NBC_01737]|uniref:hypothetical protein n=1 Tax=Dactylosporangium sp. NBC_01737 TaxID=2975959 RepID=UPI002E0E9EB1|nr:hypothetical protein OHA72_16130 [Dactylosporangium sp. NBC_01737]
MLVGGIVDAGVEPVDCLPGQVSSTSTRGAITEQNPSSVLVDGNDVLVDAL